MVALLPGRTASPTLVGELAPPSFPTNYRGAIVFGWAIIIAAFGGLALWSVLAPLSSAAVAPGTVVVDSSRKEIEHLEGGIVKEILVRDGDKVEAGQVLVRLDDTQARATLDLLQGRYDSDRAYEARLLAERDELREIVFPDDLLARAATESEVAQILEGQRRLFVARRNALNGQIAILENRIEQSKAQIGGFETQVTAKERQIALLKKELSGFKTLLKNGHASEMQVLGVERQYEQLEGERGEIVANIAGVRQAIGEASLQIVQSKKTFREEVESELRKVQAQIFDVSQKIYAARDSLDRLEVRAPTDGVVVNLAAHTVGGVVSPGSRIMDIVPENDRLVIDAKLRPDDIDGLEVGLPADIRFTAFNRYKIPVVSGVVTRVSADRLVDPKTGVPYFLVRVLVDEKGHETLKDVQLVPGMTAEVIIKKDDRTLLGYLMGPLQDILVKAFRQ